MHELEGIGNNCTYNVLEDEPMKNMRGIKRHGDQSGSSNINLMSNLDENEGSRKNTIF